MTAPWSTAKGSTRSCHLCCSSGRAHARPGDIPSYSDGKSQLVVLVDKKLGGALHDLTNASVTDDLIALASHPLCVAAYLAAPCRTWCAARRIQPGPPVLRSSLPGDGNHWPLGLPDLSPH